MMGNNPHVPPLTDYVVKMMLLEGIKCYKNKEFNALAWIKIRLDQLGERLEELEDRGK
jgi:hypothetical protein